MLGSESRQVFGMGSFLTILSVVLGLPQSTPARRGGMRPRVEARCTRHSESVNRVDSGDLSRPCPYNKGHFLNTLQGVELQVGYALFGLKASA